MKGPCLDPACDCYAEIERLRGVVEDLSDHGVAAERMERLKAQGKEIERLNKLYRAALELLAEQGSLLTRAADALGPYALGFPDGSTIRALIAELRKAAQ
jgi:hypothetical protein